MSEVSKAYSDKEKNTDSTNKEVSEVSEDFWDELPF